MIKRILIYFSIVLVTFAVSYSAHHFLIGNESIRFSLLNIYLFHVISSLLIYPIIEFVCKEIPNQTGFAFLAAIFLKIGFFVLLFSKSVFGLENLLMVEKGAILLPLFLFLLIESGASFRLLNKL